MKRTKAPSSKANAKNQVPAGEEPVSRFPGPVPYDGSPLSLELFNGRDEETGRLFRLIQTSNACVLFGPGRCGKTSLLQAGLFPFMRQKGLQPLPVSLKHGQPENPFYGLIHTAREQGMGGTAARLENWGENWSIFDFFALYEETQEAPGAPVLVIDGFEQLFALYDSLHRMALMRDLADLIGRRFPVEGAGGVIERKFNRDSPRVKLLICVDQEHLGALDDFRDLIPDLMQHRFRLCHPNREQALTALVESGNVIIENAGTPAITLDEEVADRLLEVARLQDSAPGDSVQGETRYDYFWIQLVGGYVEHWLSRQSKTLLEKMRANEARALAGSDAIADEEDEGELDNGGEEPALSLTLDPDDARRHLKEELFTYYIHHLDRLESPVSKQRARRLLEASLHHEFDAYHGVTAAEARKRYGVDQGLLDYLTSNYLLKQRVGANGFEYSLLHRALLEPIRQLHAASQQKSSRKRTYLFLAGLGMVAVLVNVIPWPPLKSPLENMPSEAEVLAERYTPDHPRYENYLIYLADKQPDNASIRWQLVNLLEERGSYNEALSFMTEIEEIQDPTINSTRRVASLQDKLRLDEDIILNTLERLKKIMLASGSDAEGTALPPADWGQLYEKMGDLHHRQGKLGEASRNYEEALENYRTQELLDDVGEPKALLSQLRVLGQLGDIAAQQNMLREAVEHYTEAIEKADDLPRSAPPAEILISRAQCYRKLGELPNAIADLQRIAEIQSENLVAQFRLAEALVENEEDTAALSVLNRLSRLYPENPSVRMQRGEVYARLNRPDKALEEFEAALDLDPENTDALLGAADIHLEKDELDDAYEYYSNALDIDSTLAKAWGNRGIINRRLGEPNDALDDFSNLIRLQPKDARAYYHRGNVYLDLKDHRLAMADFEQCVAIDPRNARAWNNLGYANTILENYEDAVKNFGRAIELDPTLAEAYHNRGFAIYKHNQSTQALVDFHRAVILEPDNPRNYIYRGDYYLEIEEYEQAIRDYTQALNLDDKLAEAYRGRSLSLRKLNQNDKADEDWEKWEELSEQG